MSWRRRNDVSLYVPVTSQVHLKWSTQSLLNGTLPRRLSGTSLRRLIGISRWRLMETYWRCPISTSPRRLKQVPNETPNDVSAVRHQGVSLVRLNDVLLVCCDDVSWGGNDDVPSVRLHDVSNKPQMKQPMTSQWYVTKMSQSYLSTTSH